MLLAAQPLATLPMNVFAGTGSHGVPTVPREREETISVPVTIRVPDIGPVLVILPVGVRVSVTDNSIDIVAITTTPITVTVIGTETGEEPGPETGTGRG